MSWHGFDATNFATLFHRKFLPVWGSFSMQGAALLAVTYEKKLRQGV
jgi:hypothetical protein